MTKEATANHRNHSQILRTSSCNAHPRKVLVFNFFAGILKRGIPVYVDNLCIALEKVGVSCKQLRCPRALRRLPRPLLNCIFVFTEQIVMPFAGFWFYRVIYPFNSVTVFGAFSHRTAVVLHDFISGRRRDNSFAARYVRLTQAAIAKGGTDVIYVSRSTMRIGEYLHRFPNSRTFLFPNAFFRFQQLISEVPAERGEDVLLCTGWGKNKDLGGALKLYLESGLHKIRCLRILGLANHTESVDLFLRNHPEVLGRITIMPQADDRTVVQSYETAAWIWVHSKAEGYGRSIAEARMCGSRVVASNIAPFREQADEVTFLYRGVEEFSRAICHCEAVPSAARRRIPPEHELLYAEITRFMSSDELGPK